MVQQNIPLYNNELTFKVGENYNLEDHHYDSKYKSWEKEYERFKQDFKKITNKNFDDILLEYQK